MIAFFLLIGFLIGQQSSRLLQQQYSNRPPEEQDEKNISRKQDGEKAGKNIKFRKKIKKYITLNSSNPAKIDSKHISVDLKRKSPEKNKSSPEPSFIALTILWAHYIAEQLGFIGKKQHAPWEISHQDEGDEKSFRTEEIDIRQSSWSNFLSKMITDISWTRWIKDPDEVKRRTILAFED